MSESEEQVSLVKDVTKDQAALSEKREDHVDYSYNDDEVGDLPVQKVIREVRQGVSESVSLVEMLRSLLNDENSVNVIAPSGSISTADLVFTHGNCTSFFEKSAEVLKMELQSPVASRRLKGYFCSDTVFNLNKKLLVETEIEVLERDLGFVPTPNLINEKNLSRDFDDFSRKTTCKWYFRNEVSDNFSGVAAFKPKFL